MKKFLVVLIVLLILIAAAVLWIRKEAGPSNAAALLPDTTVALASLPDLPRSALRWPNTTLAKIGAEPEMKAFLEKPLSYLSRDGGGDEAADLLWKLKPTRLFASVVAITADEASLLVGFQFWGGRANCEAAVARLRKELNRAGAAGEERREKYHGVEIVTSAHGSLKLCSAALGSWGFLANSLPALKDALDRAAGRATSAALAENPRYKEVLSKLSADPDFLFFIQPQGALDALLAAGRNLGAQPVPRQVEQARKVEAIGATSKLDGPNLSDTIFFLRANPPDVGALDHHGMKFTSKETAAYFEFVVDFRNLFSEDTPAAAWLAARMASSNLPRVVPEAFGPQCALSVAWPMGVMRPTGVLAARVKDQGRAEESIRELLGLFPEATVSEHAGLRCYSFPSLQGPFLNPAVCLVDGFLLLALDPQEIRLAVDAARAGSPLDASPAFATAQPLYKTANEVFGYVDSRAVFERGFPLLRQMIIFGAALMPGAAAIIDSSKLPETETIARHLQPITYAQTRLESGYLIESRGPVTMNQTAIVSAAAGLSIFRPPPTGP